MRLLRGNLVIADHGSTQPWRELPSPSAGLTYWPLLPAAGTTFAAASPADSGTLSAAALLEAARGRGRPRSASAKWARRCGMDGTLLAA